MNKLTKIVYMERDRERKKAHTNISGPTPKSKTLQEQRYSIARKQTYSNYLVYIFNTDKEKFPPPKSTHGISALHVPLICGKDL